MTDYLYNRHLDVFQRMNLDTPSTLRTPNVVRIPFIQFYMGRDTRFFLETEHNTLLGDSALIDAICDSRNITRAEFAALSLEDRVWSQTSWVAPMPQM